MLSYIDYFKKWKYIGKGLKRAIVADLIRNVLFIGTGVALYLLLNNTGLIIYIILMLKYRWYSEDNK